MLDVTLHVTLQLEGPILTQSTAPGALGVDALMARDSQGIAYLPYSHVKGHLLEACKQLQKLAPPAWDFDFFDWFGRRSGNRSAQDSSFQPLRTRLSFTDFREVNPVPGRGDLRVRVKIDPELGSAQEHMLAMMESAYAAGQLVAFAGQIRFVAPSTEEANRVSDRLERALQWTHGYGAERTIGFGKCLGIVVERSDREVVIPTPASGPGVDRLHYALTATEAFCITQSRVGADNLFVSSDVIPGGVIKGALAGGWAQLLGKPGVPVAPGFDAQRPELSAHFSAIRVRHARPLKDDPLTDEESHASVVPPLSFAKIKSKKNGTGIFRDLVLDESPQGSGDFPLTFAPDWKSEDHAQVNRHFGHAKPDTELRVRTAIDRGKRRAATAELFAYESIRPQGFRWCTTIDLDPVPENDRAAVAAQLASLLGMGLRGVGKTKTYFTATARAAPPAPAIPSRESGGDLCLITLQSPCLLANSSELVGKRTPQELHTAYAKAWHDLSDNSFDLVRYYAQQSLQGGLYLYKTFQEGSDKYTPYLLTNAGSVFLLKVTDAAKAATHLKKWQTGGLPVPAWARDHFARNGKDGADWSNQPFVPENGFGEIAVNLSTHWNDAIEFAAQEITNV